MTGLHPTEAVLGMYALEPSATPNRTAVEAHLAACDDCRTVLGEIKAFDAALAEPDAWPERSADRHDSATLAELRAFASRCAGEDREAQRLLAEYEDPDAAPRFAWNDIPNKPEYRTGGIARLLCKRANAMCTRKPLYALALAEAAVRISADLPDASYPRATIHELRGEAWKEQANAFVSLGRFDEALEALASAEDEYRKLPHEGLGLVAVTYVRATILYEQEQLDAADQLARESADVALHLGSTDRWMRALHLQGEIRRRCGDLPGAIDLFASVLRSGEETGDQRWIARESRALGVCHIDLMNPAEASRHLDISLRLCAGMDSAVELTLTHWAIARLTFLQGNRAEGIIRLREAVSALTSAGMLTDAALATIHLAEMLDATRREREIPKFLGVVIQTLVISGKRSGALAALARRESTPSRRCPKSDDRCQLGPVSHASTRKLLSRKRVTRSRDADRRRLESAADLYLHACYGIKTAARADEFAAYIRIARPYLSRLVPHLIWMSLQDFFHHQQLAYAQQLLRSTPLPVDQIALASAFGTPWTFFRRFKGAFGMTPTKYRLSAQ